MHLEFYFWMEITTVLKGLLYSMRMEIICFALQVSSMFKPLMAQFTAEYWSGDHSEMFYHG